MDWEKKTTMNLAQKQIAETKGDEKKKRKKEKKKEADRKFDEERKQKEQEDTHRIVGKIIDVRGKLWRSSRL